MPRDFFKQKVIIFFGYNGKAYHGLQHQKNSDVVTVESKLYQSLYDSNLIAKSTFGELHQSGWSRGARTDKGVHALTNAIAVKLCITKEYLLGEEEDKLEQNELNFNKKKDKHKIDFNKVRINLNSNLPEDVKVFAIKLVTNQFDVRRNAKYRLYEYIAPVCVYSTDPEKKLGKEEIQQIFERVSKAIKKFEGSHNFHNYGKGIGAKDPSAHRYIMDMKAEQFDYENVTFFRFILKGQSFIYHQIRKMMGMVIQLYQEELPDSFIDNTFYQNQLRILLAPAEGLFLNEISFDVYNKRIDIPETLELNEQERQNILDFRPGLLNNLIMNLKSLQTICVIRR